MSYSIAKQVCSESDIKRFACIALHAQVTGIDFEAAAADYGAATGESMRVMYNAALRKIRAAQANGGAANGAVKGDSPAKPKKSSPKKRKTDTEAGGAVKKARGRKPKQSQDAEDEEEVLKPDVDDEPTVKPEVDDEDLYASS